MRFPQIPLACVMMQLFFGTTALAPEFRLQTQTQSQGRIAEKPINVPALIMPVLKIIAIGTIDYMHTPTVQQQAPTWTENGSDKIEKESLFACKDILPAQLYDWCKQEKESNEILCLYKQRRCAIVEQCMQHGFLTLEKQTLFCGKYYSVAEQYNFPLHEFCSITGNQLDELFHEECVMVLHESIHIHIRHGNSVVISCMFDLIQSALRCKQENQLYESWLLLDICWAFLQGIKHTTDVVAQSNFLHTCKQYVCILIQQLLLKNNASEILCVDETNHDAYACAKVILKLFLYSGLLEYILAVYMSEHDEPFFETVTKNLLTSLQSVLFRQAVAFALFLLTAHTD